MKAVLNQPKNTKPTFFEEVGFKFLPYWPLFLALIFICCLGGWIYNRTAEPVYETTATILIKDEKKGADENRLSQSVNLLESNKIVENEVLVIQSRDLADQVVTQLHLYAPTFEKGRLRNQSAYSTSPVEIVAVHPEKLPRVKNVKFTYDKSKEAVVIDRASYPLNQPVVTPYGELEFIPNSHLKYAATRQLSFSLTPIKDVAEGLLKKIDVNAASKLASIVKLKVKDEVPERGEAILNTLIDKYNAASLDYKNTIAKNTISFVDERLRVVQRELTTVESQIQNYKAKEGIVNLSEQGQVYLKNVGENDQRLTQINMQIAALDQVEKYVEGKDNAAGIVPSTLGVQEPVLSQLLDKLYSSQLEYEKIRKTTGENNPIAESIRGQIDRIRPNVLENVKNQRASLLASKNDLTRTNATYGAVLQTLPKKERGLIDVSRQESIKNDIYSYLLHKREETAIVFASNLADSRLIEAAHSSLLPVSPMKPLVYGLSVIIALVLGFFYISSKEMLSRNILFRSEIENYTNVPVVAEITHFDEAKKSALAIDNNVAIEEQFRQLRAATGLFSKLVQKKKILVTSSISEEGKSLICSNLAISLSCSGKKVVLVDMDIRNPQSSKNLLVNNTIGIAEYLESEVEPYEVIKSTEHENLFVIAAGKAKGNPTELLLNGKLQPLFDYLEETFDYILLDTAPINPVADAFVLSDYCDLTLFVVKHGHTPKALIKKLDETISLKSLKNIAIVFNGVRQRGFASEGFGYGYGDAVRYPYNKKKKTLVRRLFSVFAKTA